LLAHTIPRLAVLLAVLLGLAPLSPGSLVSGSLTSGSLIAGALAAESDAVSTPHSQATLVTDAESWAPGRKLGVGLRLRLAPGWHTYWSNPGDAGEAPSVSVAASGGATGQAGGIVWPTPQRLPEGPLMSYAYTGDVLLPMVLVPVQAAPGQGEPGQPMLLKAKADWLTCSTVCVPDHADLTLTVPAAIAGSPAAASAQAPLFAAAQANTPVPSPFTARISADGIFTLAGAGLSPASVASAWLFPTVTGAIDQAAPQTARVQPGLVTIPLKPASAFDPRRPFDAVVVLRDPNGQESRLSVQAAPGGPGLAAVVALPETAASPVLPGTAPIGLGQMLLFALIGGLILNLMPAV
jgi:DsbC/DsbD-like thiol-disulfide interchange protein